MSKASRIGESRLLAEAGFVVMWSSGFIGAKLGTQEAATPALMAWRFLIAAGILVGIALLLRRRMPTRKEIAVQGTVGLLAQGVYLAGTVGAVEFGVAAGTSALVAALQPLLAAALAGPVLGERVVGRQWVGLAVGLVGVVLVVGGDAWAGGKAPLWAYTMPFFGMAGLVAATLVERRNTLKENSIEPSVGMAMDVALAIQCCASALLFAVLAMFWGGLEPVGGMHFWVAVAWFIVFSTFGGYGFYWLNLKRSGVTRVSSLIYLTPPTTMVWAYLMFGERVGFVALAGLLTCFCGVLLANRGD